MWDVGARVHIYTSTALGRGSLAIPMLGHLYPLECTQYSFYRRLSRPHDKFRHKGVKKIFHSCGTQDRTWSILLIVKHLTTWATDTQTHTHICVCVYDNTNIYRTNIFKSVKLIQQVTISEGDVLPSLPLRQLWATSVLSKLYKRDEWTESVC